MEESESENCSVMSRLFATPWTRPWKPHDILKASDGWVPLEFLNLKCVCTELSEIDQV